MKLRHVPVVIVFVALFPFVASALTAEEITAQIRALLAQVTQLQEQLKSLQGTQPPTKTPPPSRVCPQILRTLNQGIRGADVSELQAYLGVSQTGYFGPLTANAVMKFQSEEGISRVGTVGPQTRAAFTRRCGIQNPKQDFSATPTSGSAPLNVTFTTKNLERGSFFSVNFGETDCAYGICSTSVSSGSPSAYYTYRFPGTYTATLKNESEATLETVTIIVSPSTLSASPTSGAAPLDVSFAVQSNTSNAKIDFGDGSVPQAEYAGNSTSYVRHSYTSVGTYTATLFSDSGICEDLN